MAPQAGLAAGQGLAFRNMNTPIFDPANRITLLPPRQDGGLPLMAALMRRQSQREFTRDQLDEQRLSDLLWATAGVNRSEDGGRTAPSGLNSQEVQLYVALPQGLYRYDPLEHALQFVMSGDVRPLMGYKDFVSTGALDMIYVADYSRMNLLPAEDRDAFAFAASGAMAQNVHLYCASVGLGTVIRSWFDRSALAKALGMGADRKPLLAQTVGIVVEDS
jgi:SagB-type dehydrogenase family enzyme